MKHLIAFVLVSALAPIAPGAFAQTTDRERDLTAALTTLNAEIERPAAGATLAAVGFGTALLSFAWIGATATLLRLRALPLHEWNMHPGELMNFTVDKLKYGVVAGGALGWAGAMYAGVRWALERGAPVDYHTAEGLRRYFGLPLAQQIQMARDDQPFGDFILALDRDFAHVREGFDAQRTR